MRITVDGEPIDDPGRSSADIQRCTDVALERANIQLPLRRPRGRAAAQRDVEPELDPHSADDGRRRRAAPPVRFRMYTNYAAFIERSEVRIFAPDQSLQAEPLAVVEVAPGRHRGVAAVAGAARDAGARAQVRAARLRRGGSLRRDRAAAALAGLRGRAARPMRRAPAATSRSPATARARLAVKNIPLGSGTVKIEGERHSARAHGLAGRRAGARRRERQLRGRDDPAVGHAHGRGRGARRGGQRRAVPARPRSSRQSDWFYVGMSDLTLSDRRHEPEQEALAGRQRARTTSTRNADGRLRVLRRRQVRRRLGADGERRHARGAGRRAVHATSWTSRRSRCSAASIPTTSTRPSATTAPSRRWRRRRASSTSSSPTTTNHALWGNFKVGYVENELAAGRPRALRREPPLPVGHDHELRRAAPAARRLRRRAGHGAEPRGVPRHRRLALLPAPPGHPRRAPSACASSCATRTPDS